MAAERNEVADMEARYKVTLRDWSQFDVLSALAGQLKGGIRAAGIPIESRN